MDLAVRTYENLILLTLYGAALHFFDNVYFFDQYPEPAWLNPPIIAALWLPLTLIGQRALDRVCSGRIERSYSLTHAFAIGNLLSLGHYLYGSPYAIPSRINLIIGFQTGSATLLLILALWLQLTRSKESLRWTARAWVKNLAMYIILVSALEHFWPSHLSYWWMQ